MSLEIASLNSGSNGNCYYIGNDEEAVLVDAGISCRETEKRMKRIGLSMAKIKAIFISHEHADHILGLPVLAKKYRIPTYITPNTLREGKIVVDAHLVMSFTAHSPVNIGSITITAFPKFHDACDPHSFMLSCNDVRVGVFTDIGEPCHQVINYFRQCHAAFLETNYDEAMLLQGRYPYHLKNRIRSNVGHLSNEQALQLFAHHRPPFMSHLFLSHLSKDNNDPELARKLFAQQAGKTEIIVASRYRETQAYDINGKHYEPVGIRAENPPISAIVQSRPATPAQLQLSLF